MGLMSIIWSLATISCAFTKNFSHLMMTRFILGAGEAGYVPAGNALISALFPARLRASLIGLFMGASSLGVAVGVVLGGWIAATFGCGCLRRRRHPRPHFRHPLLLHSR